jgi:hypothetical protein
VFFAYEAMLGFLKLISDLDLEIYQTVLNQIVNNGLKALFILSALTAGVSFPMLISGKESAKKTDTLMQVKNNYKRKVKNYKNCFVHN